MNRFTMTMDSFWMGLLSICIVLFIVHILFFIKRHILHWSKKQGGKANEDVFKS